MISKTVRFRIGSFPNKISGNYDHHKIEKFLFSLKDLKKFNWEYPIYF